MEQKENKTGNTGTKYILGNREHQNRRHTLREHGNTRKILLGTRVRGSPSPPPMRPSLGIMTGTSLAGSVEQLTLLE